VLRSTVSRRRASLKTALSPEALAAVPAEFGRGDPRVGDRRGCRAAIAVVLGAIRPARCACSTRSSRSVCAAAGGHRHHPRDALRSARLDRGVARCAWHRDRGIPGRHRARVAFVGLPFVVRTVQPVIATLPREFALAAASLGGAAVHDPTPHHVAVGATGVLDRICTRGSRARSASTGRSSSSPATCRVRRRSCRWSS